MFWCDTDTLSIGKVPKLALTESHAPKISKCIGTATMIGSPKICGSQSFFAAGVQADAVALFSTTCQGLVPDAGHSWGTWCDTQLCGLGRLQSSPPSFFFFSETPPQYRLCVYIYIYVCIIIYSIYYNILYMYLYQSES